MPVQAIIGAQWGDEGKGKIVDLLAQEAEVVVRYQGGANAGHTVVNEYGKFALHLIPCGIFNPEALCIVGTGTVVNLDDLCRELDTLESKGISAANLKISDRAHISLPLYSTLDRLAEAARGQNKQGSTQKGIAPAYAAKSLRVGLQMGEMLHPEHFERRLRELLTAGNELITKIYGDQAMNVEDQVAAIIAQAKRLAPHVADTLTLIHRALEGDKKILLEGQLGAMRDLDWGIYPYVTSSNPLAGGASAGAGIPPREIKNVMGVVKAFSTCVGAGPFPTELLDETGHYLQEVGQEFGATTGRPRRCGWLDLVGLRYATRLNGFTELAITKLDTLDGLKTLKVCTGYKVNGQLIEGMPLTPDLYNVEPVYHELPGWESTASARSWDELPKAAQEYIKLIEQACKAPATLISVGPERSATFAR